MKHIFFLFVIILITGSVFSQPNRTQFNIGMRQIDLIEKREAFGLTVDELKNLKGSPYVMEEFVPGNIYKGEEVAASDVLLRYNAYSDEIEIKKSKHSDNNDYGALLREPEVFVKILNQIYVFVPFEDSAAKGHYFEIVSEENVYDLYKKTESEFIQPKFAKTSYDKDKPAEFKQSSSYFLVDKNGTFFELPANENRIYKLMANEGKAAKTYAKKSRLDLDKENDLVRLISFYNSLLQ